MKKLLMLVVLVAMGLSTVEAQSYYVPKYKKKKEVKEYALTKAERPIEVYFGGAVNFALGMQNRINYKDYGYGVGYDEKIGLWGGDVRVGVDCKLGKHFTAGLQSGFLFQDNGNAIPLSGVFKCYYGTVTPKHPCRLYNYAEVGPQFYLDKEKSRTVGMLAGAGVGVRVLLAEAMRIEFEVGYHMNMRRPVISDEGEHDVAIKGVRFNQYAHIAQFGINIYIF